MDKLIELAAGSKASIFLMAIGTVFALSYFFQEIGGFKPREEARKKLIALGLVLVAIGAAMSLIAAKRKATAPTDATLLSPVRLKETTCTLTLSTYQGVTPNHFGPDRVEPMDRSRTVLADIPARGRITITLTANAVVENALVIDTGDLAAQLRQGGNGWRNLLPMEVDNRTNEPAKVIISAWHKTQPSSAETPWTQSALTIDANGRLVADDLIDEGNSPPDLGGEAHCQEENH